MFSTATLLDLPAFSCAHATDASAATGCTVVVAREGATCGVDVRGGGPATRETDLLKPENMIERVHAVVISGGSAFGLASACGVMDVLSARKIGFELGGAHVPIVTGACLFDLLVGEEGVVSSSDRYVKLGAEAAARALEQGTCGLAEGNVGAGCGATVGKMLLPEQAMKSGLGVHGVRAGDLVTCAIVAVNAIGQVRDAQGSWIAGCNEEGRALDPLEVMAKRAQLAAAQQADADAGAAPCTNTTLGIVVTNAALTKAQATKVSSTTHDAYARAIKPVHTSNDGDTIFTFASGEVPADADTVAIMAAEAMQLAIVRALTCADAAYGLPCARDFA